MTALGDDGYRSPNVVNPTPDPSHPGKYVHQGLQRGSEVYNRGLQRASESYNIPLRSRVPTVKKNENLFLKCREATTSFPFPVICHFEALRIFPQEHVECFCFILQKSVAYTEVFGLRNEYFR